MTKEELIQKILDDTTFEYFANYSRSESFLETESGDSIFLSIRGTAVQGRYYFGHSGSVFLSPEIECVAYIGTLIEYISGNIASNMCMLTRGPGTENIKKEIAYALLTKALTEKYTKDIPDILFVDVTAHDKKALIQLFDIIEMKDYTSSNGSNMSMGLIYSKMQ